MSQPTITTRQREILRHALGLNYNAEPYRNHYCTGEGSDDYPDCEHLVDIGLMDKQRKSWVPDTIYTVTAAGLELAHGEAGEGAKP